MSNGSNPNGFLDLSPAKNGIMKSIFVFMQDENFRHHNTFYAGYDFLIKIKFFIQDKIHVEGLD